MIILVSHNKWRPVKILGDFYRFDVEESEYDIQIALPTIKF